MLRSIFSNWLALAVTGLTYILLTPILIHGLGDFYYGMWVLVVSVLDYYGLLDMGMRWTFFRFVARFNGANDRVALNQTFTTALALAAVIGVFLIALTLSLVILLPSFFKLAGHERHVFQWLVSLLGLSVAVTFPTQLLGAFLRGFQRFDLDNVGLVFSTLVRAGLLAAVVHWGYGVVAVSAVTLIIAVLSLPLYWKLVRCAKPDLSLCSELPGWTRIRELVSYSFYVFVNNGGEYLRFYTDSVVIARILGVALITPFSIATRFLTYFRMIVQAVNGPVMTEISELDGQGKEKEVQGLFLRATRSMAVLSLFLGLILLLDGQALIRVWLGAQFLSSYPLLLVLTIGYVVHFAQEPCRMVIFAQARYHRILSWWTLAEGLSNLLLSIYWGKRYGLFGVALGTTVPLVLVKISVQPWYALRALKLSAWYYVVKALCLPIIVSGLFAGFCFLVQVSGGGILELLWTMCWQSILFALLVYSLILSHAERQSLWRLCRQFAFSRRSVRVPSRVF